MSRNKLAAYIGYAIPVVSVVGLIAWASGNKWKPADIEISGDFIYDVLLIIALVGSGLGSCILGSMAYDSIRKK